MLRGTFLLLAVLPAAAPAMPPGSRRVADAGIDPMDVEGLVALLERAREIEQTTPAGPAVAGEIARLVERLRDDNWKAREDARMRLEEIGRQAGPALCAALDSEDPEVGRSARGLLDEIFPSLDPQTWEGLFATLCMAPQREILVRNENLRLRLATAVLDLACLDPEAPEARRARTGGALEPPQLQALDALRDPSLRCDLARLPRLVAVWEREHSRAGRDPSAYEWAARAARAIDASLFFCPLPEDPHLRAEAAWAIARAAARPHLPIAILESYTLGNPSANTHWLEVLVGENPTVDVQQWPDWLAERLPPVGPLSAADPAIRREAVLARMRDAPESVGLLRAIPPGAATPAPEAVPHPIAGLSEDACSPDPRGAPDILRDLGVDPSDPASIVRAFEEAARSTAPVPLSKEDMKQAQILIQRLGSESWQEREDAATRLLGMGHGILPLAREAAASTDPEVAHRATILCEAIGTPTRPELIQQGCLWLRGMHTEALRSDAALLARAKEALLALATATSHPAGVAVAIWALNDLYPNEPVLYELGEPDLIRLVRSWGERSVWLWEHPEELPGGGDFTHEGVVRIQANVIDAALRTLSRNRPPAALWRAIAQAALEVHRAEEASVLRAHGAAPRHVTPDIARAWLELLGPRDLPASPEDWEGALFPR